MKANTLSDDLRLFFAPEHGGTAVKAGRPQSDPEGDGGEQISDAMGQPVIGHAKTPGTGDPGAPGSRTNPVHGEPTTETDETVGKGRVNGPAAGS